MLRNADGPPDLCYKLIHIKVSLKLQQRHSDNKLSAVFKVCVVASLATFCRVTQLFFPKSNTAYTEKQDLLE